MLFDLLCTFFHWFIIANDWFTDLFFEVREKSFHNYNHLSFRIGNSFFNVDLFFFLYCLLLFHFFLTIFKFFDDDFKGLQQIADNFTDAMIDLDLLFELSICLLISMLVSMNFDAGGAQGKQALRVFAKVKDQLFWMKCAWFRFVEMLLTHKSKIIKRKIL